MRDLTARALERVRGLRRMEGAGEPGFIGRRAVPGGAGAQSAKPRSKAAEAPTEIWPPVRLGLLIAILFFGAFLVASWFVPLQRAALAPGSLVVEGSRRAVQHLEGGIVQSILVKEGSIVTAGEPVVLLDDTIARTQVEQLTSQLIATDAQAARLIAEAENDSEIRFPAWFATTANKAEVAAVVERQRRIFKLRRDAYESQVSLLQQRSKESQEEINGLRSEIAAQARQIELMEREHAVVDQLMKQGLERMPRLLLLERQMADIEGARGKNIARIAQVEQSIIEDKMKMTDLAVQLASDSAQKLRDEEVRAADLRDRLRVAQDTKDRTVIRAPISGKIVNLKVFTERGVINPRESIMEIVPSQERLVVDAQVSPNDVDIVHVGADVDVRFVSLSHRATPIVRARLVEIAADRQTDQRTGASYYTARISIPPDELSKVDGQIFPGMPVEVAIIAGTRTIFEYLTQPIVASFFRSLKEK